MGAELWLLGAGWPVQVVALGKPARQVWWAPDTSFFLWHICKITIGLFLVCWVFVAMLGLSLVAASKVYSTVVEHGLLVAVASLADHEL